MPGPCRSPKTCRDGLSTFPAIVLWDYAFAVPYQEQVLPFTGVIDTVS